MPEAFHCKVCHSRAKLPRRVFVLQICRPAPDCYCYEPNLLVVITTMLHLDLPLRIGSSGGCAIIVVVPEASFLLFIVIVIVMSSSYTFGVPKLNSLK
ncbi:MAG TPA: hypothetical protein PKI23_09265 [Pseudomonadales bacterium]|nr:hypothetical protein [Pseudomonadales bacterium]HMZ91671.1 hypothetical protein [Pseudomonadales bacterium]HND27186.1 hypothetical protein [Pseudomonadales bacterium]HNF08474.1 hypothetical protein [Pseudomonadales bacterium]HNN37166.1 hypothetical protein [Pseudomonadales bacterium]